MSQTALKRHRFFLMTVLIEVVAAYSFVFVRHFCVYGRSAGIKFFTFHSVRSFISEAWTRVVRDR